jgi:hypothetical protein
MAVKECKTILNFEGETDEEIIQTFRDTFLSDEHTFKDLTTLAELCDSAAEKALNDSEVDFFVNIYVCEFFYQHNSKTSERVLLDSLKLMNDLQDYDPSLAQESWSSENTPKIRVVANGGQVIEGKLISLQPFIVQQTVDAKTVKFDAQVQSYVFIK